jgi:hypothetical protein
MAKIQTVGTVKEFMSGEWKLPKVLRDNGHIAYSINGGIMLAEGTDTFARLHVTLMNAFDAGVVLIIVFAGACWCFGHRSKALEILIGVAAGYVLARHAIDIRNLLRSL